MLKNIIYLWLSDFHSALDGNGNVFWTGWIIPSKALKIYTWIILSKYSLFLLYLRY